MADFNAQDYFARLAQDAANQEQVTPLQDKYLEIKDAVAKKKEQLEALAITQQKQQELNKNSWVGKLDLDPNSLTGEAVNLGANLTDGAATVASNFMTSLHIGRAATAGLNVPDEVRAAYARLNNKPAIAPDTTQTVVPNPFAGESEQDKADKAVLALPAGDTKPNQLHSVERQWAINEDRKNGTLKTNADQIALMNNALDDAKTVRDFMDVSSIVHRDNQRQFEEDLRDGYKPEAKKLSDGWDKLNNGDKFNGAKDIASGLTGLFTNIGSAAINNKTAVLEYITNNMPQLALAANPIGMGVTNISYAVDEFGKGMQAYREAHGGALPNQAETAKMAAWAASLAVAETLGDKLTLGVGKAAGAVPGDIAEVARKSLKDALHATAPGRIAAHAAEGGIGEFATEAYQTAVENHIEGKAVTAEDAYVGGAIGALVGAGTGGSIRTLSEATKSTPEHQEQRIKEQTDSEALQASIKSGDVSAYLDPKNASYAPEKAVAALYGNAKEEGATPETKQANLEQATKIISDLEDKHTKLQDTYDSLVPAKNEAYLAQVKEELVKADPSDTETIADLKGKEELLQGLIDDTPKADPKKIDALTNQINTVTAQLNEARDTLTAFHQDMQPKDLNVEDQVAAINAPVEPASNDTAQPEKDAQTDTFAPRANVAGSVINLSMAAPERLSIKDATSLADNTSNALTEPQRTYLRAFSEARQAENALRDAGGVSSEIYTGSKKNVGIAQYRARTTAAIAAGNESVATNQIQQLQKFEQDHQAKAEVAEQALKQGMGTQIVRTENGKWLIATTPLSRKDRAVNGGLTINSASLVQSIRTEANALTAATKELKAAYALKFDNNSSTQGIENVQNSPQRQEAKSIQPSTEAREVPTTGKSVESKSTRTEVGDAKSQASGTELTTATQEANASTVGTQSNSVDAVDKTNQGQLHSTEGAQDSTVAEDSKPSVVLTPLAQKSPEGTSYKAKHLVADYFTQTASREGDATARPLASVKDFISQVKDKMMEFIPKDIVLSTKQEQVIQTFQNAAKAWDKVIQRNLSRKENRDYWSDDMMQYLVQGTGNALSLDENIKTAMTYAGFSWVAENAARTQFNTDEEINNILDRDETTQVSQDERNILGNVGARQNVVINTLGQRAVQALGLKTNPDAPRDLMPRLESHIGAHIMKMLMDQGIIERVTVPGKTMAQLTGSESTNQNAEFQFLKLVPENDQVKHIAEASKGTQGVLDKLFSVDSGLKEPGLKPIPYVQKKTSNTNQDVPSYLAKILKKQNATPNYFRQDMLQLITQLDDNIAHAIAGVVEVTEEGTHKANRPSIQAKNDGLIREYTRLHDYLDGSEDHTAPIYFDHVAWKQQRVGIATNVINPQSSKIHRFMLYQNEWTTEVQPGTPQYENFQLRVLEGLGMKTDKQSNEKSLAAYESKVSAPAIKDAVEVLRKTIYEGGITTEEQNTLLAGVKAGGENFHTLDALVALAHEAQAIKEGKPSFTVQMMGEVDGVTNGPMLSHLLMGAAQTVDGLFDLLNRGGFYKEDSAQQNYNLWRNEPGHRDLYENTALHMTQNVLTALSKNKALGVILNAVYSFTGTLADEAGNVTKDGRNIIKTPLTAMVFGSSVSSAVDSMANNFIESIYEKIEKASKSAADTQPILEHINTLLILGKGPSLPSMSIKQLMEHQFTPDQVKALKKSFKDSLGKAVEQTMKDDFGTFIAERDKFNLAAQTTFELYNAAYTALREAKVKELVASGEIASNPKTGAPLHDLTPKQETDLRKQLEAITPLMHTAMSKESDSLNAGLYISKSDRKFSTQSQYQGEVKFGTPFKDNKASSTKTRSYQNAETAPGVAMAVLSTHAFDSYVSHTAANNHDVLNVHDAHGAGLGNFQGTAERLNQAVWTGMLNYSPATEMFNALSRTVTGLASLAQEGKISPEAMESMNKYLEKVALKLDVDPTEALATIFQNTKAMAVRADDMKLQALEQMQSIDQYALEGGNYQVTESDRAEAKTQREALVSEISAKEQESLTKLVEALGGTYVEEAQKTVPSPFGEVGEPLVKSDSDLVKFFEANPDAKASDVIKLLAAPDRLNAINRKILQLISKVVNPNLSIKYVTTETPSKDVLESPAMASRGWYVSKDGKESIYVLGTEFKNSGLTAETLLHELVHGALARTIEKPSAQAKELIKDLESIRTQAQQYIKENNLNQYSNALENVHELVAYGMSNLGFQRDVLNKLQVKANTKGNTLVQAMQKFVETLSKLLFKNPDAGMTTGLGALITNVSGLFYEAAQNKPQADINLSMASNPIDSYSTMEVYEALDNGSVTPIFDTHLRNLLSGIVEKLHGPFGALKDSMRKTEAGNPLAVWLKALETGKAPFASSIVASGFAASNQEDFAMQQVEATVKAALDGGNTVTKLAYTELSKLYTEAYNKLKPSDFKSQADYDFVFKLEANGNRSDYLARFAALGLGHQGFNSMLQMASDRETRKVKDAKTFSERLNIIFTKILEFFADKVNKTYVGQTMDSKLEALVNQLVDIEAKKRHALTLQANSKDFIAPIEEAVKKGSEAVREKVLDIANSPKLKNATNGFVAGAGGLVRIVANNQVNMVLGFLKEQADGRKFVPKIIQEIIGHDLNLQKLSRGTKENERHRKSVIDNTAKFTLQTFLDQGKGLTKKDKSAIASVVMRTGLHNLLGHFDLKEIQDLIGNKASLNSAITTYENNLQGAMQAKYIEAANVLGNYKATGNVRGFLMMNAHVIARMMGTPYANQISEKEASKAEESIKVLASLYALKYSDVGQLSTAHNVLEQENQRSDGNGVEFVMAMQKQLEAEALEKVFSGNPTLMVHGYTPEILNPHTSIQIANEADGANLLAQGYAEGAAVISDSADPSKEDKRIYVLRDGGMAPWLSGAISLTGMGAKGAKKHNGYLNPNTVSGTANSALNTAVMNGKVSLLTSNLDPRRDLSKVSDNHLAPVYNEDGGIVNWRYLMAERTKDTILERTNDFEQIMGTFAGSTYDKVSSREQNQKVIQALYDQFSKDFASKRSQYVLVGPNSPDVNARELWNQQSMQTKKDARAVWGGDGMWVKTDSLDLVFGYRKLSIANFLREEQDTLHGGEKILREWFNIFAQSQGYTGQDADNYAKKIGIALTKGERAWQEIVREAKDIIVVKTGVVMLGNIWSNESLLTLNGVPLKGRINHHLTAMKGATSYQRDTAKLQELQAMIDSGYTQGNEKQIQRDIIRLKDAIDRNPVRVLVEEGLMPTIVEDVAADQDNYSYKTAFARKTEKYTNKLNPVIKNVAKQVYMTHDTKQYQTLARITQLSDFVARYTLYQHLISRKTDPLSHEDAIQKASEAFVNYDIPMHRGLQYTDDMGITMFTKYFLRIQKPLMDLAKEQPARVLGTVALNKFMSLGPIVLESSFMHHLGWNPVRMGALEYPSAFGQLPAFDAMGAAFKLIE